MGIRLGSASVCFDRQSFFAQLQGLISYVRPPLTLTFCGFKSLCLVMHLCMICTGIGQYQQLVAHSPVSLLVNFEGSLHHTSGLNTGAENILFIWGVPTFQNALHVLQIAAYQTNTVPLSNIKI